MNREEFIGLKSSEDLFGWIEEIYSEYYSAPTETKFLALIFALNHLRDWISGGVGHKGIEVIPENQRNAGQIFYEEIYGIPEFGELLNPLCNGIKHFKIEIVTEPISGFKTGLGRSGDSLSAKYFLINGTDSRNIFERVLQKYREYFTSIEC